MALAFENATRMVFSAPNIGRDVVCIANRAATGVLLTVASRFEPRQMLVPVAEVPTCFGIIPILWLED
ncbi:hypothetical protein [Rhodobacter ferrooxidans]|uniref:Uncharacterized protein n=1 Tax=Rhodobacter ferrooxidans TaxID=371731 RepID=C8S545_9RHOB|nr:hypothetical protein [Rhodobacter sp. SW2]EEW23910.1 hypothetical protein Rsw2DRAFT_3173 [Rhodobacter sp. SW2]